jgi:hypothetical protein
LEEETVRWAILLAFDISMEETHVCVVDRDGVVVYEGKSVSVAEAIADELAKAPSCRRIVFETGRIAPILFHGGANSAFPWFQTLKHSTYLKVA